MGEKDDDGLGLSLSLKCPEPENIHPPPPPPHPLPINLHSMFEQHKNPLPIAFQYPSPGARSNLRGFDINRRPPSAAECEEEAGASSPNSTISSVSGKRSDKEEAERGWGSNDGGADEDDGGDTARKKLRLSKEQSAVLEETFKEHNTLNPKHKVALAKQLNLRPRQVEVWFQNRRARTKLKQTEVDCEYLKTCCENLTGENRRLQKEVNELRALKLSPQSYMDMKPPTTLTMCPSCERVAVRPPPSSASASSTAPPAISANRVLSHLKSSAPQHQRSYAHNPGP